VISPLDVVQYYYQYLVENMDSDSISHVMVCRKLLTNGDMEAIGTCSSNRQRNVLILNHVQDMNVSELFAFRDAVQELEHQCYISTILTRGKHFIKVCSTVYIEETDLGGKKWGRGEPWGWSLIDQYTKDFTLMILHMFTQPLSLDIHTYYDD